MSDCDFAALLDVLGHGSDEFTSLLAVLGDGTVKTWVHASPKVAGAAKLMPADSDHYFSVNTVRGPARTNAGRGTQADVTRVTALYADIDVKVGACRNLLVAQAVITELAYHLGVKPTVVVSSGGGLQPYWPISDCHDPAEGAVLLARFHCLVKTVAVKNGATKMDNVCETARMLRIPGTFNMKIKGQPRPVTADLNPKGRPMTVAEVTAALDKAAAETPAAKTGRSTSTHAEVSAPDTWKWARQTCAYTAVMIAGFRTDSPVPGGGRSPWLISQRVRLLCAYRLGCITEADYKQAQTDLEARFAEVLADPGLGDPRDVKPQEYRDTMKAALKAAAAKTDDQARAELGEHTNPVAEVDVAKLVPPAEPITLAQAHTVFRRWLGNDYDTDALDAMLAAAAVERFDDGSDPVWMLVIGGPGAAKTETVQALDGISAIVTSSLSSEAALLSATPKRERGKNATGGLLRKLGERGVLVVKDVTSILSMNRDLRARVLAALREIYDGRWYREVGTDGGLTIAWHGRIVVVGAVTTAWDTAHAVIASMGDRFVLVRLHSTAAGRQAAGRQAIGNTGSEKIMRAELAAAVAGVIAGMDPEPITVTDAERDVLLAAADLVTLARTGVEYDYRGDVIDAHEPEQPTRFAKQLTQIVRGAVSVGMSRPEALRLAIRCARDSVPPLRLAIIEDLDRHQHSTTGDVRRRINKPRATVDRQLQALHILGVAEVDECDSGIGRPTWYYSLAEGIAPDVLKLDQGLPDLSVHTPSPSKEREEGSELGTDISGTPSDSAVCA